MLETFTVDTFAPRLMEIFRAQADPRLSVEMQLIAVTPLGAETSEGSRRKRMPFSLLFRASPQIVLPQQIYQIEHPEIGTFDLFLVPLGPQQDGMHYEAIFT